MSENLGKSVKIFLAEGTPNGILTAEIINWTGHILSAPRSKLANLLNRKELEKPGVYFLTGVGDDGQNVAYIGESLNVGKRLMQHNKDEKKDFWEKTFVITSKDQNLTSGHIKFIESKLINIAKHSAQIELTNDTSPDHSNLPEADIADMNYFILQIRLILPILGLEFLKEVSVSKSVAEKPAMKSDDIVSKLITSPMFELNQKADKIKAYGIEVDGQFVVLKGSEIRSSWVGVQGHNYQKHFEKILRSESVALNEKTGKREFIMDVIFSKPSAAAAVILGRAANGRSEWKIKGTNQTYADWQTSQLPELIYSEE